MNEDKENNEVPQVIYHTHNGVDSPTLKSTGISGTKIYYVADSSGGAVTRKLTFVNGVLISET